LDCTYLVIVESLSVLLGLVLGLLSVDVVKTLGLTELVDLSAGERGNELLGELVVDRLALLALSLLESVHGSERGTTSDDLVRELALVVVVVGLLVRVGRFTWMLSVLLLDDHNLQVVLTPAEHCD
jgi:hypothetical protein